HRHTSPAAEPLRRRREPSSARVTRQLRAVIRVDRLQTATPSAGVNRRTIGSLRACRGCRRRSLIWVRTVADRRVEPAGQGGRKLMRTSGLICCISLAWCGTGLAQSEAGQGAPVNHLQGAEMNATLSQNVDARKAKTGDAVTATLTEDVRANGRLLLLRGT